MSEELRTEVERLEMTLENSLDELDRVKSEAAELRGVARKLAEAIQTYVEEHGEMDCFECYERMYNALGVAREHGLLDGKSTAGSDYVSKAEVRPIAKALVKARYALAHPKDGWKDNVENQTLIEAVEPAIATARKLGVLEDN